MSTVRGVAGLNLIAGFVGFDCRFGEFGDEVVIVVVGIVNWVWVLQIGGTVIEVELLWP